MELKQRGPMVKIVRIIGSLSLLYGVLVTLSALFGLPPEIQSRDYDNTAYGIVSMALGLLFVVAALHLLWAFPTLRLEGPQMEVRAILFHKDVPLSEVTEVAEVKGRGRMTAIFVRKRILPLDVLYARFWARGGYSHVILLMPDTGGLLALRNHIRRCKDRNLPGTPA